MKKTALLLIVVFLSNFWLSVKAQTNVNQVTFNEVELLVQNGNDIDEKSVQVRFSEEAMAITSKNGSIAKTFRYSDIRSAEYSYSKNPRWKTGLGLGAASIVFPPLLLVALPLGFSKHRRHWITIRTDNDYAVLKLSKSTRKMFIPTLETKTGRSVRGVGEDK